MKPLQPTPLPPTVAAAVDSKMMEMNHTSTVTTLLIHRTALIMFYQENPDMIGNILFRRDQDGGFQLPSGL